MLHDQESWLASNRDAIAAKIQIGWDSAARGELADEPVVRARLKERQAVWLQKFSLPSTEHYGMRKRMPFRGDHSHEPDVKDG